MQQPLILFKVICYKFVSSAFVPFLEKNNKSSKK